MRLACVELFFRRLSVDSERRKEVRFAVIGLRWLVDETLVGHPAGRVGSLVGDAPPCSVQERSLGMGFKIGARVVMVALTLHISLCDRPTATRSAC